LKSCFIMGKCHPIPIIWFILSHASDMSWNCKFSNYELGVLTIQPWILSL
jgi:hypothetical protein